MRIAALLTALLLVAAAPAAGADKPKRPPLSESPDLWATVNVCDTAGHPNVIGVRGSMPGLGKRKKATLLMRFRVQYLARADGRWHPIANGADSRWVTLGRATDGVLESGWSFEFQPPAGGSHTLRGEVTFRWRIEGREVRRLREVTEAGHRSTRGADPPGFSAATCQIS